jgi:hypothetical protein
LEDPYQNGFLAFIEINLSSLNNIEISLSQTAPKTPFAQKNGSLDKRKHEKGRIKPPPLKKTIKLRVFTSLNKPPKEISDCFFEIDKICGAKMALIQLRPLFCTPALVKASLFVLYRLLYIGTNEYITTLYRN